MQPSSSAELLDLIEIDRELGSRSLGQFVKMAWPIAEPGKDYIHGWHIDAICEHLEAVTNGQIRNLLINMPPRHMKSLLVSVFWPTWVWTTQPSKQWLYASYAMTLSVRDSVACRRIIESPWYQARWGHVFALTGDVNLKARYENDQRGQRIATSVGGVGTGEGGDIVVVDDAHNVNEALSDTVREGVIEWWTQSMSTRLNDPKTGSRVIVGQRVHDLDLSGHVLKVDHYEHLCLPAEYEPGRKSTTALGNYEQRTKQGELLHPERFDAEALNVIKRELGTYGAAGQLQQNPTPKGGGRIKEAWFRYWDVLPHAFDQVLQSWDPTFDEGEENDYVVGQVWGRRGAEFYLIDQVRDQMDAGATMSAVRNLTMRYPMAVLKLMENKANGPAIRSLLTKHVPGIVPITPKGNKVQRVQAVAPAIEARNVVLPNPETHPWVADFIGEVCSFPVASHDDQVDAMSQALMHMLPAAQGVINKAHREAMEVPQMTTAEARRAQLREQMNPHRKKRAVIDPYAR